MKSNCIAKIFGVFLSVIVASSWAMADRKFNNAFDDADFVCPSEDRGTAVDPQGPLLKKAFLLRINGDNPGLFLGSIETKRVSSAWKFENFKLVEFRQNCYGFTSYNNDGVISANGTLCVEDDVFKYNIWITSHGEYLNETGTNSYHGFCWPAETLKN
ncbi:MAG: hypothetical protein IT289_07625 [Oligoflexia bacterium]|nr:hypothetical protein [Oligoflexia bacterium]